MIARNAQTIIATAAVPTFLVIALEPACSGLYWLLQLNGKVDYLQAELEDTQVETHDIRQEVQDTGRELPVAIEQSENRILDALADHSPDERGNAIFTRPVRVSG